MTKPASTCLALGVLVSGCSLLMSSSYEKRASTAEWSHSVRCMPDRTGPVIDTVIASAVTLLETVLVVRAATCEQGCGRDFGGPGVDALLVGLISIPIVIPYALSARYGFAKELCP